MIKIKIDFSNGPVRLLRDPDDTCEVADGVDRYSFLRIGLAFDHQGAARPGRPAVNHGGDELTKRHRPRHPEGRCRAEEPKGLPPRLVRRVRQALRRQGVSEGDQGLGFLRAVPDVTQQRERLPKLRDGLIVVPHLEQDDAEFLTRLAL
jgi:hypothetical protein